MVLFSKEDEDKRGDDAGLSMTPDDEAEDKVVYEEGEVAGKIRGETLLFAFICWDNKDEVYAGGNICDPVDKRW